MEIFVDGGLFELLIAIGIGYSLNFIFKKKYLLLIFSILLIVAPGLLFFIKSGELFYWLISVCIFNAFLLVILLWKQRLSEPDKPLFEVRKFVEKYRKKKITPS